MRLVIVVIALTLIAHSSGVGDLFTGHEELPHVDTALAIKCDHLDRELRDECVDRYEDAFSTGEIEPIAVLRMHCTRWHNSWEESSSEPPVLCIEQFGGWVGS